MKTALTSLFICLTIILHAQVKIIDEIVAVVGDEIILYSDLLGQKDQYLQQGLGEMEDLDCQIMESVLFEKLLLHRARVDSVVITEGQIQGELDRRIDMFSQQLGGLEKLEEFYGKTEGQIRAEFHAVLEDQLLVRTMQQSLTSDVHVTPAEIEAYFKEIPADSIPLIDSQVEVSQILVKPEPSEVEIEKVKTRLNGFRDEVAAGKDFATLAILYSEDPGSAGQGGELGLVSRGVMVPEFERVAYNLDEGEVSKIFETDYGLHIMQMIDRQGDMFNARHVLIKPKLLNADLQACKLKLDSIANLIALDSLTFDQAAARFSDDEGSRNNNGIIINPNTGSLRFNMDELEPQLFLVIDKLNVGEISQPTIMRSQTGDQAYRLVKLRYRSEAHKANLVDDYQLFQTMTQNDQSDEAMGKWTKSNIDRTYIKIDEEYNSCDMQYNWLKVQ